MTKYYDFEHLKVALDLLAKKWTVDILLVLVGDSLRYSQIEEALGEISSKMLTERLQDLQEQGLIEKSVLSVTPLKIEYKLTKIGIQTISALMQLLEIGEKIGKSMNEEGE